MTPSARRDWLAKVNRPLPKAEMEVLHESVNRGRPFGDDRWVATTAARLGLGNTLRKPGRPPGKAKEFMRAKAKNQK